MTRHYIDSLDADKRVATMRLYGSLGGEVNGHWFAQELAALDGENLNQIDVWVNSPGGDVFQGMSIASTLLGMNTPVTVYVGGVAASMAAVFTVCADRVVMMDYAKLMIHDPAFSGRGALSPKEQKTLGKIKDMLGKVLSRRGKEEVEVSDLMSAETWFSAAEAKEHGLCDEILPSAKAELLGLSPAEIIDRINAEYKPQNPNEMKLTNEARTALGVTDGASEADVSAAVITMQAALNTANQEKTALEARATAAEQKLEAIEAAKVEAQKVEARTLIEAAKKDGRIDASNAASVTAWEQAFAGNHENTRAILDGMPKHTPVAPHLGGATGAADNTLIAQSWDELDKADKLRELKEKHPDEYAAKFEQKFGRKPTV